MASILFITLGITSYIIMSMLYDAVTKFTAKRKRRSFLKAVLEEPPPEGDVTL